MHVVQFTPVHAVLRPATRLGQRVNGLFCLWSTGQGPIYNVKIRVKGLQPVDMQNVELVQCRVTSLPIYKPATTAKVPRKGCALDGKLSRYVFVPRWVQGTLVPRLAWVSFPDLLRTSYSILISVASVLFRRCLELTLH